MKETVYLFILVFLATSCGYQNQSEFTLQSPNRKISVEIAVNNSTDGDSILNGFEYSILYENQMVSPSNTIGLEFKDMPGLNSGLRVVRSEKVSNYQEWERVWGRSKKVINNYRQLILTMEESREPFRKIYIFFRAFDDGIAFRYEIPEQENIEEINITSENTTFNFQENHIIWAADYGGFASHQESEFQEIRLSEVKNRVKGLPLVARISDTLWISITEANLTDWAGMYLTNHPEKDYSLLTRLSPLPDDPGIVVKRKGSAKSPWRVMMISRSPGRFLETNIIQNLNDPCEIEDPSWIKPGKSAWDWWWSNYYAPFADFELGSNTETMKYFIDFASEMGWEYQLVDWHWYGKPFVDDENGEWVPTPDADITTMNPDIDIPELVEYANLQNVRLLLWLEWEHADRQMDEAFPLYEKWGIAGVKVDFMARDDQEMVNFYHRLVTKAAEHHLLVDFHGAYKPTGYSRTYPNLITREGVMGNEYTKWSNRITPEHTVTLALTRNILGEMDFTPGAFVNVTKEDFKLETEAPSPMVMGTRCNQLAMFVVYESALQVICDSPDNYRNSPAGLDFLKIVPTTWDETKVINAQMGDLITVARRSGDTWYVGSMTDWDGRTIEIPLDFLKEGSYLATIWKDSENSSKIRAELEKDTQNVNRDLIISAKLVKGGGHVMVISPTE